MVMRPLSILLACTLACACHFASADLISPQIQAARDRLRENPNTYDRVDNFCTGKKPGEACLITGSVFSGGGSGSCNNVINENGAIIDLTCVRTDEVSIDRKLPEDGFVNDPELCKRGADRESGQQWNCKPMVPTPSDRFCKGKKLGGPCVVELVYQGRNEQGEGICQKIVETESFYFEGHRTATRQVIRCEPPSLSPRTYNPASWRQKLFQ